MKLDTSKLKNKRWMLEPSRESLYIEPIPMVEREPQTLTEALQGFTYTYNTEATREAIRQTVERWNNGYYQDGTPHSRYNVWFDYDENIQLREIEEDLNYFRDRLYERTAVPRTAAEWGLGERRGYGYGRRF